MQLFQKKKRTPPFAVTALAAALVAAGMAGPAFAGGGAPLEQASHVEDLVTPQGGVPPTWLYEYTVYNDGWPGWTDDGPPLALVPEFVDPQIRDWELPWFGDAGITDIMSPAGWTWSIEDEGVENAATGWDGIITWKDPTDPWFAIFPTGPFQDVTQVLHWYVDPDDPNAPDFYIPTADEGINVLSGFSFIADYGDAAAPYQASWVLLPSQSGDPAFPGGGGGIPGSPLALDVPEPGTLVLLAGGLLGWSVASRKRKPKKGE